MKTIDPDVFCFPAWYECLSIFILILNSQKARHCRHENSRIDPLWYPISQKFPSPISWLNFVINSVDYMHVHHTSFARFWDSEARSLFRPIRQIFKAKFGQ